MPMTRCVLCPRRCDALRDEKIGKGVCGMGLLPVVARAAAHMWEEPCISGSKGSGTIFFSGCPLGCVFCQNALIAHQGLGRALSIRQLSELFARVEDLGVHNLNLVNPTHFVPAIAEALARRKPGIPVVWNSSGYEDVVMVRSVASYVDVFLPDLKYATAETAGLLAGAPDYFETALAAISAMCKQTGPPVYEKSLLQTGTLIRHLVLPLRVSESISILDAIARHLPAWTPVSLMRQYTPMNNPTFPGLNRRLTAREYARARNHMQFLGLPGYFQQKDAADSAFTPAFLDEESTRLFPDTES
ncbi:MAG: radical SAM protein [Clostridia bacterium]|nr:radical SAM protein [Clostridia bacterium]